MSWKTSPLGKVTNILSGTTPESSNPAYWNGDHVWVTPTDLGKLGTTVITSSSRLISEAGRASCNPPLIPQGAVVMSSRAPIGHLAISGCHLYTNQGCKSFVCTNELDSEFLYFTLKHRMVDIQALGSGATFVEVSKSALAAFEISYPESLDEQRQIVARLKAQLAEVETARQAAQAQVRDAMLLHHRLLRGAFGELDCVPTTLGLVLKEIQTGKSFQTAEVLARPEELGVLKVSAVSWSRFRSDQAKALKSAYTPAEYHRVKQGDLLISRANTRELVGAVVLVEHDYPMRLLSDKTLRLLVDENRADKNYLLFALRTELAREHIELYATGTSDSMRNISQDVIASTPILLPSLDDQRRLVTRLKTQLAEAEAIAQAAAAQLAEIERLPQRLLAQAFEPQGGES